MRQLCGEHCKIFLHSNKDGFAVNICTSLKSEPTFSRDRPLPQTLGQPWRTEGHGTPSLKHPVPGKTGIRL